MLDDHTLVIPDRPGNNRLDTMRNILVQNDVGLFFVRHRDAEPRRGAPRRCGRQRQAAAPLVIVVKVHWAFIHCGKALNRSRLWQDDYRADPRAWALARGTLENSDTCSIPLRVAAQDGGRLKWTPSRQAVPDRGRWRRRILGVFVRMTAPRRVCVPVRTGDAIPVSGRSAIRLIRRTRQATGMERILEATVAILSILGALLIGAASPGPSFVLVARTSIALSRRDGLAAALGMGIGGVIFGALALLGLNALLTQVAWLYAGLKIAGGLYLLYLAVAIWRGADKPIVVPKTATGETATGTARSFYYALATQLSNPKTAIVYGSIFAALLPASLPRWMLVTLPLCILLVETCWYMVVALAFSSDRPRAAYLRFKTWIDRLAACVMGALGLRLIVETVRYG